MNYYELQYFASDCQIAADEMASKLIEQKEIFNLISIFQSHCDFNLAWFYQISPEIILHKDTIVFLVENKDKFKRKLNIKQVVYFDYMIIHLNTKSLDEIRNRMKKSKT